MSRQVILELPDQVSDQAEKLVKEWSIIALQQEGELTIREAAGLLGLEYEDYIRLLAQKRLPASNVVDEDKEGCQTELMRVRELFQAREK